MRTNPVQKLEIQVDTQVDVSPASAVSQPGDSSTRRLSAMTPTTRYQDQNCTGRFEFQVSDLRMGGRQPDVLHQTFGREEPVQVAVLLSPARYTAPRPGEFGPPTPIEDLAPGARGPGVVREELECEGEGCVREQPSKLEGNMIHNPELTPPHLQRAVIAICDVLARPEASDGTVDLISSALPMLHHVVSRTVVEFARGGNHTHSFIARLPVEVLSIVFDHLLLPDRVSVARVCGFWRQLSKNRPITVPSFLAAEPARLHHLLSCTDPASLVFQTMFLVPLNKKSLPKCIHDFMHRIRILSLEIMVSETPLLCVALQRPAPQLRGLRIVDVDGAMEKFLPRKILSFHAPKLHTCCLDGFGGLQGTFAMCREFTSIRILGFRSRVGWDEIRTAFTAFPHLETFTLAISSWEENSLPQGTAPKPLAPQRSLTRLGIVFDDSSNIRTVISLIQLATIPQIAFACHGDADRAEVLAVILSQSRSALSIDLACFVHSFSIRMTNSNGTVRIHRDIDYGLLDQVLSQLPGTPSSATFSGLRHVPPRTVMAPISIRHLTFILDRADVVYMAHYRGIHFSRLKSLSLALPEAEVSGDHRFLELPGIRVLDILLNNVGDEGGTRPRRVSRLRLEGITASDLDVLGDFADEIQLVGPLRGYTFPNDDIDCLTEGWPYD
ncbi:hypothetical protein AURDEDRAFT_125219 [Auricularia subglabra TFB-10046 SS5]|nr:hypothetical protein AURDEDRAFT_125219 [Auricularia subglabra TFB-10046 SS5]